MSVTSVSISTLANPAKSRSIVELDPAIPVLRQAKMWLDASDAATITASGSSVSQWNDKSGNGRNVTQATGANQPATGVATVNGLNALRFGTDDWMTTASFTLPQPLVIYAVFRTGSDFASNESSRFATVFDGNTVTAGTRAIAFARRDDDSDRIGMFAGTQRNHALSLSNSTTYVAGYFFNDASSKMRFNGVDRSLAGSPGTAGIIAGVAISSSDISSRMNSDLCEVLMFTAVPTSSEVLILESYLRGKWGI